MERNRGKEPAPFERAFRDGMMTSINADIPDTWEGFCLLNEVLLLAEKSPLEDEVKDLWNNRRDANIARLNGKLAAFEADGNLEDLNASVMALNYIQGGYSYDLELVKRDRAVRREKLEMYLRLIRAVARSRPEELVHKQLVPPDKLEKGWGVNNQIDPVKQMELVLKDHREHLESIFFSFVRNIVGTDPAVKKEILDMLPRFGMDALFQKNVEERLRGW